jgi:hypothetical protein
MAGLDPAIHVLLNDKKDVDARHRTGHDEGETSACPFNFPASSASRTAISNIA